MGTGINLGGGISIDGPDMPLPVAPTVTAAASGTSLSGTTVILGQVLGAPGNPGILLNNCEIPQGGFPLVIWGGNVTLDPTSNAPRGDPFSIGGYMTVYSSSGVGVFSGSTLNLQNVASNIGCQMQMTLGAGMPALLTYRNDAAGYRLGLYISGNTTADSGVFALYGATGNAYVSNTPLATAIPADLGAQFHVFGKGTAIVGTSLSVATGALATAMVHIGAGTAAAGTAPLKLNPGVNNTAPEVGAIESTGDILSFVQQTGPNRRVIALMASAAVTNDRIPVYSGTVYQGFASFQYDATALCLELGGGTGVNTTQLIYGAGTTTRAPYRYTAGTNLTTPVDGSKEFDGTNEYVTVSSVRYKLAKTLTATAVLDFPNTASLGTSLLTVAVTGAALGDPVFIGAPAGSVTTGAIYWGYVSVAGTVTISYFNGDAVAQNPASGTFSISLQKI